MDSKLSPRPSLKNAKFPIIIIIQTRNMTSRTGLKKRRTLRYIQGRTLIRRSRAPDSISDIGPLRRLRRRGGDNVRLDHVAIVGETRFAHAHGRPHGCCVTGHATQGFELGALRVEWGGHTGGDVIVFDFVGWSSGQFWAGGGVRG